ncbi:Uncharacterized protein TCM_016754 [Theobroma cacao]|uniref:DUF4283 domain-containing protein n=1 Tax=Theobroma cacao TaxID=3641 RepID=A0A061G7P5_THECC|nr:Uncharacterized protein TCM_016754 [Theobroma cacao]
MPRMNEIRLAFKGIGLTGAYDLRWLDYKHILIHLTNQHDFNRIWIRQVWFIANQKLRVFKWSPDFQPEKESSLVSVWISFPNLRTHLHEKSALMIIAKAVGKLLFADEATANGSRPSVARVCVEYDCQKQPLDHIWIVSRDQKTRAAVGGFTQRENFSKLPDYCSHCGHVGHAISECIVLGNRPDKSGVKNVLPLRVVKQSDERLNEQILQQNTVKANVDKRSSDLLSKGGIMEPAARVTELKQNKKWQIIESQAQPGTTAAKGEEIITRKPENVLAEGGRATSTAELIAGKSKSHAERAQKNSVIVRSCTPLQLMQGERKDSGYASIHAYGDKTNEGKGHDVDQFSEGNEHPITRRHHKLQNKAKPILTKLIPSHNVDFDVGSVALLFDKTSDNDESQLKKAKEAIDEDNSAEYLKNLPLETGKCLLNKETDSVPSFADACSSSEQVSKLPNPVQYQTNLEDQISIGHPRVHRRRKSDSSLLTSIVWNFAHATDPLEGPWMVGGDFNTIMSCAERLNGAPPHGGSMEDFAATLLDCGLIDAGWENKTLSPGGRITLLRSVLSSMPMYLLQVLKPPVVVIEKIERLFNSFLWGDSTTDKRMHWVAWYKLTFPCSEGGLDIRRLNDVSDAFMMKLWWRFQTCDGLWTNFLKTKYCMGQIPHYVQSKLHDSQWKGDTDIAVMWGFTFSLNILEAPQIIHWVKPVTGEYKLNVDGSYRHNQSAATGGLLRDHTVENALSFHVFPFLPQSQGMAAGRPPDLLPTLLPVAAPSIFQSGATPNPPATENSKSPLSHGHTQGVHNKTQPSVSPRTQKKSFLAVAAGEKASLIPLDREPFWYKDRPTASFFDDEISTLAQPFKFSMVGKFFRMPRM